jgi:glutamate-1-semialdehyde aminotransferase/spore coat polysaccharide biosynthesis protein SpsF (cytidylyltransferase family)
MTVAIVQARMSSTRLPGKVLLDLVGSPMLWHIVRRLEKAGRVDRVVVATSREAPDDRIAAYCAQEGILCFRGSEADVLDRFYEAAKEFGAETVVRITGDCPLVDPTVVDLVLSRYQAGDVDYVSNTGVRRFPDGLDVEVFSFDALEVTWSEAKQPSEREHVTPYMRTAKRFRTGTVAGPEGIDAESHRWTVDHPEDVVFVRRIFEHLYRPDHCFDHLEVLRLLDRHPELLALNRGVTRNEGLYRSLLADTPLEPMSRDLAMTREYSRRARAVIPGQSQTFSKGPSQFVQGPSPAFLARGKGSHVWDVDGNEYIDLIAALGPVVLGYDYPAVTRAATEQLRQGVSYSLSHPLEVEVAETLVELIPCAEMVRFGKNGSDATAGAVRLARAYTGREKIACCGYHGWQDWYIGTTSRSLGVPESTRSLTLPFDYNDIDSLHRVFDQNPGEIAAVVMEPVGLVEPRDDFLEAVKDLTRQRGALLVFDEIVTGFRVAVGGAQEHYSVTPDIGCFGKAMANGFPLSAIVGRAEIMAVFEEIFYSFTFGGEAVSLAAARATLSEFAAGGVIDHLWHVGRLLKDGFNVLTREFGLAGRVSCVGLPPRTVIQFSGTPERQLLLRSLVQQEMVKRGVLFLVGNTVGFSHDEADVDHVLRAYRAALGRVAEALDHADPECLLEGDVIRPVFREA